MKKRIISLAIAVCLLVSAFVTLSLGSHADTPTMGVCGNDIIWAFFTSTGELTLNGTGETFNYDLDNYPPWVKYDLDVKTITVNIGITGIGDNAFNLMNHPSVSLPHTIESVGEYACYGCKIGSIPSGIISIGDYAFSRCSGFSDLTIPGSVVSMGDQAFAYCGDLCTLNIEDGLEAIPTYAFYGCEKLTTLSIPKSVKKIENGAFAHTAVSDVYYAGSESEWKQIEIEKDNSCFETAVIHYGPFTDVPEGKWYTDAVLWCYAKGYMTGTSATTFEPNSNFTRAMFVTVLAKIDKADTDGYNGTSFTDVPEGKWYSKPIQWAYRNEYASGLGNGKFGPNDPVTREQLAQFLYNYTQKKGYSTSGSVSLGSYPDGNKVSNYAKNAVAWAVGNGLISGVKAGDTVYLQPKGTATRAQVALIVKNYVDLVG